MMITKLNPSCANLLERPRRMRYLTRDGIVIEGASTADVIDDLRAHSRSPGRDRAHFIEILARGARLQTGAPVRASDCDVVLADLEQAGLLERLDDSD